MEQHCRADEEPDGDELQREQLVVESCWTVSGRGRVLHHTVLEHPLDGGSAEVVTTCGRRLRVSVPGIFTRLGAKRCDRCCRRLGLPSGVGSPKNDPECREVLGLDAGQQP